MKKLQVIVLLFTISLISCNCKEINKTKVVELIDVETIDKIDNTAQLIDVRTPEEYADGYIKNAKNIDFQDEHFLNNMSKLDKSEPVYVYCKSGGRSAKASQLLKEAGFEKIYDLEGGFLSWEVNGKIISKD
ncbi:rhodanese-like domain-containing protein [Urechidicola croceus]|uniref:Rhodanese domain-containing protein n=1 Tax=Urechidicola croceus TaxID=1850246 RepID=A0A1D8PA84_9FLAO|nr:rhodanese-like domain-containing protein [Urechidicola croceus]AOW21494.1 hypothetical protein LPB138_12750 [Urechidicola croceus]